VFCGGVGGANNHRHHLDADTTKDGKDGKDSKKSEGDKKASAEEEQSPTQRSVAKSPMWCKLESPVHAFFKVRIRH